MDSAGLTRRRPARGEASSTSRHRGLLVAIQSPPVLEYGEFPQAIAYPLAQATEWDVPIGYVFRRDHVPEDKGPEFFLEVQYQGYRALLPCRQGRRAEDTQGLLVLEDGSLWLAPAMVPGRVVAQVCR